MNEQKSSIHLLISLSVIDSNILRLDLIKFTKRIRIKSPYKETFRIPTESYFTYSLCYTLTETKILSLSLVHKK